MVERTWFDSWIFEAFVKICINCLTICHELFFHYSHAVKEGKEHRIQMLFADSNLLLTRGLLHSEFYLFVSGIILKNTCLSQKFLASKSMSHLLHTPTNYVKLTHSFFSVSKNPCNMLGTNLLYLNFLRDGFMHHWCCKSQLLCKHSHSHPTIEVQKRFNVNHNVWSSTTWWTLSAFSSSTSSLSSLKELYHLISWSLVKESFP